MRRPKRLPHWTHQHQIAKTLDAMPVQTTLNLRDRAMLETLFSTACRTTELRLLDTGDIELDVQLITLGRNTPHERTLPLTDHASDALRDYLSALPHTGALWLNQYGYRIDARSIRRALPHTPRKVRASALTALLAAGADLRATQTIAGHRSITTTARYEQLTMIARLKPDSDV